MLEEDENDRHNDEHTLVGEDNRQRAFDSTVEVDRLENAERESVNAKVNFGKDDDDLIVESEVTGVDTQEN